MKLKVFDTTTTLSPRNQRNPHIVFSRKGSIKLNRAAVEKLNLKEGDEIAFVQDEDQPANWYITKSDKGWKLRKTAGNDMIIQSVNLVTAILPYLRIEAEDKSKTVLLAGQPEIFEKQKYFGILLPFSETD